MTLTAPSWKPDWTTTAKHFEDWWNHRGMVFWTTAPKDTPHEDLPKPDEPDDLDRKWTDPAWRFDRDAYNLSRTCFGGDAFPKIETYIGAGDLAAMIGCKWHFAPSTVWFEPCITDPDNHPPFQLDRQSQAFRCLTAIVSEAVRRSRGRFLVTIPDLVENFDILSALRDPQTLLYDCVDRPEWVEQRIASINAVFFEVFDHLYEMVRDDRGGNAYCAFGIWGPGKTAKVQCDACAMFGPETFARFVKPALTEQCRQLDYPMYHLDGPQCIVNLDELLSIEPLRAIQWTCGVANEPVSHPRWFDMYRRILKAGKSLQIHHVEPEKVIPVIEAIGTTRGVYISSPCKSEEQCRRLAEQVDAMRS
ncbi:MAG: hypothetical protein IT440_15260 [Phycisphaeraceae bacterium]|nr:hypothetical protein [Phycisphaeraceae bacterium]